MPKTLPIPDEYYAMNDGQHGLCSYYFSSVVNTYGSQDRFGAYFAYLDLVILIPVLTFLAFDKPHDCFTCLAKDPDRNYSIFQLSLEERVRRKMMAKFSKAKEQARVADQNFIPNLLS